MSQLDSAFPFDVATAASKLDGDLETLRELATIFLETYPEIWHSIRDAARERNSKLLYLNAHRLKSSVGNFFAAQTNAAASDLERMGRENDWRNIDAGLNKLEVALVGLTPALANFAANTP